MNWKINFTTGFLLVAAAYCLVVSGQPAEQAEQDDYNGLTKQQIRELQRRINSTAREYGVVESASSADVICPTTEKTTILSLQPEGRDVKKGDLLVVLDDSAFQKQLQQQQIHVELLKAKRVSAEQGLQRLRVEAATTIAAANKSLLVAELAREKYLGKGGEFEIQRDAIDREINIARQRLLLAQQQLKRGQGIPQQLEEAQLAILEAKAAIETTVAKKQLLTNQTYKFQVASLELEVTKGKAALLRTQSKQQQAVQLAQTDLKMLAAQYALELGNFEQIKQNIAACRLYAKQAGNVVHAHRFSSRGGIPEFVVEPGAVVRPRQAVVRLVDLSRMQVSVKASETHIHRIHLGQPAIIRCDAFPDREFRGKVVKINGFAEPGSFFSGNVKRYKVIVSIDKPSPNLRTGLTALVEIDTRKPEDR